MKKRVYHSDSSAPFEGPPNQIAWQQTMMRRWEWFVSAVRALSDICAMALKQFGNVNGMLRKVLSNYTDREENKRLRFSQTQLICQLFSSMPN